MIKRIDHVNIAVKDVEAALTFYRDKLGLQPSYIGPLPEEGIKHAILPTGDTFLELIEPTDPQGAVAKFLEARGEGLYTIFLEVDDLDALVKSLKEKDIKLVDTGSLSNPPMKYAFVHPRSASGVILGLIQKL